MDSQNSLWKIWDLKNPFKIPGTGYTIKGFSIAALRTNFFIKELNLMLDAGISCPSYNINTILITHSHSDHCANLPFHLYQKNKNEIIKIYVPSESCDNIKNFIKSGYIMSSNQEFDENIMELIPINPEDTFDIIFGSKIINVEVIKCYHSVPCIGYGLSEKKQKLLEKYLNIPSKELIKLKKDGIQITQEIIEYFLCFIGDTNKEILKNSILLKYKTIMIECTFLFEDEIIKAEKTYHMHWNDLKIFVIENPDKIFILYHFSQRYKNEEILNIFKDYNNIIAWVC